MYFNVKNLGPHKYKNTVIEQVFSPYDNSEIGEVECINESDVENVIDIASKAFLNSTLCSKENRIEIFKKVSVEIKAKADFFSKLIALEGGKPLKDAQIEVSRAIEGLEMCASAIQTSHGKEIPMGLSEASKSKVAFTQKFPVGPVFAISAFNHPLNLIVHQIGPAIAAGCPIIIKPALDTPCSCYELIKLFYENGLPQELCQMINTNDNNITQKFVMDTRISFLSFIGSAKVGWKLKSMMPPGCMCALEHGGVAPVVIDKDYNYQNDLYKILRGAFYHAGQVCVSIQNIFVNKKIINNFSEEIVANAKKLKVGDPLLIETDVGPLIRNQEVNRVEKIVDETLSSKMGELLLGGKRISNSLFECTILRDTDPNSKVFKNEIFGPVINILEYDEMDDVINLINQSQFGFQSSLFSNNMHNIFYFYEKVQAKTVLINEQTAFRVDWMPFGGIKNSGEGEGGIFYSYEDMLYNKLLIIDKS